ncbi:MAG: hypothetical protein EP330_01845 [Deltaproteobacteria bacterium]|nr:MAG: hypothetical protein EP330_01845 [Deltaproteobacteria bacterium]
MSAEDFDEVLPITHAILMEGFSENLGFSPISLEEYRELVEPLRPLIVPGACPILVFDAAGEPAAYGYTYPDLGPQVRAAAGLPTPALDAATNPYRGPRLIMHTMTVRKPYRKMGVPQALMAVDYMPTAFENGFAQAIGAVAKEGRTGYDRTGEHSRAYHLYELR